MELEKCRYIVVEGPIGAGKTSLARQLASRLDAEMLLEQPEDNPFLSRFYDDMPRFALPTQLTFLFQRADQLRGLSQLDLFRSRRWRISFVQGIRCSPASTSPNEYALYEKVYGHLKPQTPTPDLVIYLQAPVDTLVHRVQMRGAEYERSIPDEYLARLADAYSRFFYQYDEAPCLIINSERLNFVDVPAHLDMLLARVSSMRARREFFNLGEGDDNAMKNFCPFAGHWAAACWHGRRAPGNLPAKPIRLIVPFPPGAGTDTVALCRAEARRIDAGHHPHRQQDRRRRRDRRRRSRACRPRRLHAAVRRRTVHDRRGLVEEPGLRSGEAIRTGRAHRGRTPGVCRRQRRARQHDARIHRARGKPGTLNMARQAPAASTSALELLNARGNHRARAVPQYRRLPRTCWPATSRP